mgnify:CR=1 FL=1
MSDMLNKKRPFFCFSKENFFSKYNYEIWLGFVSELHVDLKIINIKQFFSYFHSFRNTHNVAILLKLFVIVSIC